MSDVKCPYCEEEQEINHDDGQGYEENTLHHQECNKCEKTFTFTTSIIYVYHTYKADCLKMEVNINLKLQQLIQENLQ